MSGLSKQQAICEPDAKRCPMQRIALSILLGLLAHSSLRGGSFTDVYNSSVVVPYSQASGNPELRRCGNVRPAITQQFRAKSNQQGAGAFFGPRVNELDALSNAPTAEVLEALAGNNQYTEVSQAFAAALRVRVLGPAGAPLPGVTVQFERPTTGASATLSALSGVSDSNGIVEVTATANGVAGRYAINAGVGTLTRAFALNNDPVIVTRCTGVGSSTLGFRDDFNGTTIAPARWTVDANDGSVTAADGQALVSAGTVSGFPYVGALGTPLPATGAFSVRWVSSYLQAGTHGTSTLSGVNGLPADGGPNADISFGAGIAGSVIGGGYLVHTPTNPGIAYFEASPSLLRREVEICYFDDRIEAWVDGVLAANRLRDTSRSRPNTLYFGQFNRGFPVATWSNFLLDLVEVRQLQLNGSSEQFELLAYTISPGGGRSSGGAVSRSERQTEGISEFEIGGAIAQPITGETVGGEFSLESGYWQETNESNELLFRSGFESP
jgi:hypothetical protein